MESLSKRQMEKLTHEMTIIAAAEKLFCMKGFTSSSMDEIAKESGFTKRTVYQYFESKEDLYYASAMKGWQEVLTGMKSSMEKSRNGFEKIESACRYYCQAYEENQKYFELVNNWTYIGEKNDSSKRKKELTELIDALIHELSNLIEAGKSDGSIQTDLDSDQAAHNLFFLITGFFGSLTAYEPLSESASADNGGLCYSAMELVLKSLKRSKAHTATRKGTA